MLVHIQLYVLCDLMKYQANQIEGQPSDRRALLIFGLGADALPLSMKCRLGYRRLKSIECKVDCYFSDTATTSSAATTLTLAGISLC